MPIISWQFGLFVVVVLAVYYLLPRKAQNIWLLTASVGYIATWNTFSVVVLMVTILVNYAAGLRIWQSSRKNPKWLWFGIAVNLAALFFFRIESSGYLEKMIRGILHITDTANAFELRILLPVGFSYYCLQAISYLVDVSHQQCEPEKDLAQFSLYMAYFPRLISGPIERARSFLPVIASNRIVDNEAVSRGFTRIIIGLIRKVVLAGILSGYIAKDLFSAPGNYSSFDLIFQMFLYAFWVYNDFAGYTSIVRGVSDLFGISLSANFDTPYFAHSFTDFWNRWHISLSHWLRDYIFYPFSRFLLRKKINPRSVLYLALPPLITMMVSGLWHNFGAFMLCWGMLHGLFQAAEKLMGRGKPAIKWEDRSLYKRLGTILLVFTGVVFTWVPFASGSLSRVAGYFRAVFTSHAPVQITTLYLIPLYAVAVNIALDWIQYHSKDELVFRRWPIFIQSALLAAALLAILVSFLGSQSALTNFVYQGF